MKTITNFRPARTLAIACLSVLSFTAVPSAQAATEAVRLEMKGPNATPLCTAIAKGDFEIVKKFVEYGADVNQKSNGLTPLMFAVRYNRTEIIKFLLENGARTDEKSDNGFTALKWAEATGNQETITILKGYAVR